MNIEALFTAGKRMDLLQRRFQNLNGRLFVEGKDGVYYDEHLPEQLEEARSNWQQAVEEYHALGGGGKLVRELGIPTTIRNALARVGGGDEVRIRILADEHRAGRMHVHGLGEKSWNIVYAILDLPALPPKPKVKARQRFLPLRVKEALQQYRAALERDRSHAEIESASDDLAIAVHEAFD